MIKIIKKLLSENLVFKIVSLLLAILMWFIVVNEANPVMSKRFRVPLNLQNEEVLTKNNYVLLNRDALLSTQVDLYIRAPKSVIDSMSINPEGLEAFLDLKPIDISSSDILGEPQPLSVKYELPNASCEVVRYSPYYVDIILDKNIEKIFPITLEKSGEVNSAYMHLTPHVTPNSVVVSGPMSVVNTISAVKLTVNLTDATSNIEETNKLEVFDYLNRDITSKVKLENDSAEVFIQVNKYGKITINKPTVRGQVKEGLAIDKIDYEPKFIEVIGEESDIEAVKSISLETIDVDGLSETKSYTFDLRSLLLDKNLSVKNYAPYKTVVTVKLKEEETREFEVSTEQIVVSGTEKDVLFADDYVTITLKGYGDELDKLLDEGIKLSVDISQYDDDGSGLHNVLVHVELPDTIKLVEQPRVDLEFVDKIEVNAEETQQ